MKLSVKPGSESPSRAKEYQIGQWNIEIIMRSEPVYSEFSENREMAVYGNAYNLDNFKRQDLFKIDMNAFENLLNNSSGYYFVILYNRIKNELWLANDIFGNYRMYYKHDPDKILISDDWKYIYDNFAKAGYAPGRNEFEEQYFRRHRYTTCWETLFDGMHKIPPASMFVLSETGLKKYIYFKRKIKKDIEDTAYAESNRAYLTENIKHGTSRDSENILYFTGGIDSTYLAILMNEMKIPYNAVFMSYDIKDPDNLVDELKAVRCGDVLGINLEKIRIPIEKNIALIQTAARNHIFDKAFSIPFYYTSRFLREKYGKCNIINGQSSDSIYCWGASTKTVGGFLQRYLASSIFYNNTEIVRTVSAKLIKHIYRYKWKIDYEFNIPSKTEDYYEGLLDPLGYLPVNFANGSYGNYRRYLRTLADKIAGSLDFDPESVLMYMKMNYLQGPSNIPVIESAREYGHNLVMPYLDPRIVYLKMRCQNDLKNLFFPRYVLEKDLKDRFNLDMKVVHKLAKREIDKESVKKFLKLTDRVYSEWDRITKKIL